MLWLCTEHQKQDGVTVLSAEVSDALHDADQSSEFHNLTESRPGTARRKAASKTATKDNSGNTATRRTGAFSVPLSE